MQTACVSAASSLLTSWMASFQIHFYASPWNQHPIQRVSPLNVYACLQCCAPSSCAQAAASPRRCSVLTPSCYASLLLFINHLLSHLLLLSRLLSLTPSFPFCPTRSVSFTSPLTYIASSVHFFVKVHSFCTRLPFFNFSPSPSDGLHHFVSVWCTFTFHSKHSSYCECACTLVIPCTDSIIL